MSHPAAMAKRYGEVGLGDKLALAVAALCLPAAVLWRVATSGYAPHNKERTLRRIASDALLRFMADHASLEQLQSLFPSTLEMYTAWTKASKLPYAVDELGEDARLLWIGPRRLDKVVLFAHGGGYSLPASDYSVNFWRHVQLELEKQDIHIGIALLNYTLVPTAHFPTQLNQARLALSFLFTAGVKPQNLQLAGDSAGGNLLLQVLSHVLHPRTSVPEMHLPAPVRGVCLISPWTNLRADSASHVENTPFDTLSAGTLREWGRRVLVGVTDPADAPFAEAVRAPEGWFAGVDGVVERVLVTAGGKECLRDDVVVVGEMLRKHCKDTKIVVQPGGLHEDMYLDFLAKENLKRLGSLTPLIVEWMAAGFQD